MTFLKHSPTGCNCEDFACRAARAASQVAPEVAQPVAWQPIASAPKDGTRVILSWGTKAINGYFLDNSRSATPWAGWRVESMVVQPPGQPTHWQPYPPPKITTGGQP
jgi:hypothetical protein